MRFKIDSRVIVLGAAALLLLADVTAAQQNGDIMLTGYKSSQRFGRLVMFLNGEWGTVCSKGFDLKDANVACRQMGLGLAMYVDNVSRIVDRFGYPPKGTPIQITDLQCKGDEKHLLNCAFNPGNDGCSPTTLVEMSCSGFIPQPKPGDVRLVGGTFPSRGQLEVFHNGSWVQPCTDEFGENATSAVCTQLGYNGTHSFSLISQQAGSTRNSGLRWKSCSSSAVCASSCLSIAEESCSANKSIQVTCSHSATSTVTMATACTIVNSSPNRGDLRLVNGSSPNQGRLEFFTSDGWRTICGRDAKHFPVTSGHVACRLLGFVGVETVHTMSSILFGTGTLGVHTMVCSGGEEIVDECDPTVEKETDCTELDSVGLTCNSDFGSIPYGAITLKDSSGSSGSLSVYNGTNYGPVCDGNFTQTEADVACRQLGYGKARSFVRSSYFPSEVSAVLANISCQGKRNSSSLLSCPYSTNISCGMQEHISLHCLANDSASDPSSDIRLVEGNGTAGIVEVHLDNQWRAICSTEFAQLAAVVACLQLGFYGAYGHNITAKNVSDDVSGFYFAVINCRGHENRLDDCNHVPIFSTSCDQSVSISCKNESTYPIGSIRLLLGENSNDGRLEVFNFDRWGPVCYTAFDENAALVACKQLGYVNFTSFMSITVTKSPPGYNIRGIHCSGNESRLVDCPHYHDGMCSGAVALECNNVSTHDPTTSSTTPTNPVSPTNTQVGIPVGVSLSIFLLLLVAILIVLTSLMVRRCLRRRKREAEESDWMPNTSTNIDMSFHNPRFEEPAAAPLRGVSSSPPVE